MTYVIIIVGVIFGICLAVPAISEWFKKRG